MCLKVADTLIVEPRLQEKQAIQVHQTVKKSMAPVMLCIMQNPEVS